MILQRVEHMEEFAQFRAQARRAAGRWRRSLLDVSRFNRRVHLVSPQAYLLSHIQTKEMLNRDP